MLPKPNRPVAPAAACLALIAGLTAGCASEPTPLSLQRVDDPVAKTVQFLKTADQLRQSGDVATAALFYRRAAMLDPKDPAALLGLAETHASLGNPGEAARAYAEALAMRPDDTATRLALAKLLIAGNKPEEALAQFQEAVRQAPDDHRGYAGLGVALDLAGRHGEAQEAFAEALLRAPTSAAIRNNLALSLALSGDYDAALRLLDEAGRDAAVAARAADNRALVLALSGDWDGALAAGGAAESEADQAAKRAYLEHVAALSGRELAAAVLAARPETRREVAARGTPPAAPVAMAPAVEQPPVLRRVAAPAFSVASAAKQTESAPNGAPAGAPGPLVNMATTAEPASGKAVVRRAPQPARTAAPAVTADGTAATAAAAMATLPGAGLNRVAPASATATLPGFVP